MGLEVDPDRVLPSQAMRLQPPMPAPQFEVEGADGSTIALEQLLGRPVWLVLSRYAACPFCSLRVDRLIRAYPEVAATGLELLVVFPSPLDRIERYVMRYAPPFRVAADPEERVYAAYANETSWAGTFRTAMRIPSVVKALVHAPNSPLAVDGPMHRMPAEFLIDREGQLVRAHYGVDFDDGFSIPEVVEWAKCAQ
jgi:thioredoxin-dependent peroxiredoxin